MHHYFTRNVLLCLINDALSDSSPSLLLSCDAQSQVKARACEPGLRNPKVRSQNFERLEPKSLAGICSDQALEGEICEAPMHETLNYQRPQNWL